MGAVNLTIERPNAAPPGYTGYQTDNLKDYSVVEDATTINAATYTGGFGQITVPINAESPDIIRVINDVATLSDPVQGKVTGTIRNLTNQDGDIVVTADSILGLFNADKVVKPFTGTLRDAFEYYCSIVEIPFELVVENAFDENGNEIDDIANRPVQFPGWVGNMWDHLKEILVSQSLEISQVFDQIYVRPLRSIIANTDRNRSFGWAIDNQTTSRQVEVMYYPTERKVDGEFYPIVGQDPTVYQVDANEVITFTLQLSHSLETVNQPECVEFVENRPYPNTLGVYAVAGNDGLPVKPAWWITSGGNLSVTLTDDPSVVEVSIYGPSEDTYAPYRIAMTSGEFYNSMHLTGTGLFQEEESVVIHTGATTAVTGDDIGTVVKNRNIQTAAQAYTLGMKVAGSYALAYTITGEAFNLNRPDASRDAIVSVVRDLDEFHALNIPGISEQLGDFNDFWTSFPQFDTYWREYIEGIYENQAFGNAAGARVLTDDSNFRIDSATLTPAGISYSGSLDTIVSDFDGRWENEDVGTVTATNLVRNPRPTSSSLWRVSSGETLTFLANDRGEPALEAYDPVGGGVLYLDPNDNFTPQLGEWVAVGYDLCALDPITAKSMRVTLSNYAGDTVETGSKFVPLDLPLVNYITNPSFEVNTTGWVTSSCTIASSPNYPRPSKVGDRIGTVTVADPTGTAYTGTTLTADLLPVGANVWVGASILAGRSTGASYGRISLQWYAGTTAITVTHGPITALPGGDLTRLVVAGQAPPTATTARILFYPVETATGGTPPNGVSLIDAAQMVIAQNEADARAWAVDYVDGSLPPTEDLEPIWTGTAHNSISRGLRPYQRVVFSSRLTAYDPAGYLRAIAWPSPTVSVPRNGFRLRRAVVSFAGTQDAAEAVAREFFDGSTPPNPEYNYSWTGVANASTSQRLIGIPPLDSIDENWGPGTTVNDFSLMSLRRTI